MKRIVKRLVTGTPLEPIAHSLYRAVTGKPPPGPPPASKNDLYDLQTEQVLQRVLKRDSNCVDVGCHAGAILDAMLRSSPKGTHHAFEPLPHLYDTLVEKYRERPNVLLHRLALSDAPGESTFHHVVSNPGYSGILERRFDRPHEDVVQIQVKLARLDDILPADLPIRAIKIDVEGAELQVLRGAQQALRRWRPYVIFEHGMGGSDVYGTRPEMVFDLFAACGMRVTLLESWLARPGKSVLSREAFIEQFDTQRNYYFMAHA